MDISSRIEAQTHCDCLEGQEGIVVGDIIAHKTLNRMYSMANVDEGYDYEGIFAKEDGQSWARPFGDAIPSINPVPTLPNVAEATYWFLCNVRQV